MGSSPNAMLPRRGTIQLCRHGLGSQDSQEGSLNESPKTKGARNRAPSQSRNVLLLHLRLDHATYVPPITLRAPTRAPTAAAAVATAVAGHDAAAEAAAGSVAQVDDAGQGVGGVNGAGSGFAVSGLRTARRRIFCWL